MTRVAAGRERDWRVRLAELVASAPAWMRELASDELHIGGFTNVQLDTPVLDAAGAADDRAAERALIFFIAAALVGGRRVARVRCGRGPRAASLARIASARFRRALERLDDENVALMHYFDVYLAPAAALDERAGGRLVRTLGEALGDAAGS